MIRLGWLSCLLLLACGAPTEFAGPPADPAASGEAWSAVGAGSRCVYIDESGTVVIGDQLDIRDGFEFGEGLAGVKDSQGRLGYVDRRGKLVIPFQFQDGTSHREGHAGVLKDGMCGYIDLEGELVVPLEYDLVTNFRDGWGLVKRGGRFTFVNGEGEEIGARFVDAESFSEGLAAVAPLPAEKGLGRASWRYGFIDGTGTFVIPATFEEAEPFSEGLAAVRRGGKWGYVDGTGAMVVEPRFDLAGPFHEGLAPVNLGAKMGYIDTTGRLAIEPKFEADRFQSDPDEKPIFVGRFVDGLAAVRYAKGPEARAGWGFIDRSGGFVTPPEFEDAYMFSEGLAAVKVDGKWGYIDSSGRQVIPSLYERAEGFSDGLSLVCGASGIPEP